MIRSRSKIKAAAAVIVLAAATVFSSVFVNAAQPSETSGNTAAIQRYYFDDSLVNAGLDTGFAETNRITKDDPHFGWTLGKFNVTGFTRVTDENTDNPVFLKTLGDKVTLWFKLDQDINKLNGDENLKISDDANGYDEYFGIDNEQFKRGTLIVKHSDYQNKNQEPVVYTDYLTLKTTKGADTTVELFEEGDYEIALDYEIEKTSKILFVPKTEYFNYRISFKFSVRNGNCMVYPFDTATKKELNNTSITPNGFYLDLAKSRYLDIDIKKEVLKKGADGLTEDVRFNSPAKDGDKYTSEGIYTITVSNRYTEQKTQKKIYVGDDDILKAYITTGLSIHDIRQQIANGAEIQDDGTIVTVLKKNDILPEKIPVNETAAAKNEEVTIENISADVTENKAPSFSIYLPIAIGAGIIISACIASLVFIKTRNNKKSEK